MTISLCTFLRAVSYGLLLPFYVCGTELRRSLQRQGLQPVVLVLALTVILQWEQTFATLGGQYVGIVCSIALYAITAYALLRRSIGLALQQALCFFLLTDCTDTIMRFANMRLLGYDPLRSGTFWAALLAYLPLTTVQGTLCGCCAVSARLKSCVPCAALHLHCMFWPLFPICLSVGSPIGCR